MTSVDAARPVTHDPPPAVTAEAAPNWSSAPMLPPAPAVFTDPVAAALASLAQLAEKTREAQQQMKKAQVELRKAFEKKQVDALRQRADHIMNGAIVSAGLMAVSASAHVAGAAVSSERASKCAGALGDVSLKASDLASTVAEASAARVDAQGKSAEHSAKAADDQAKLHEDDAAAAAELAAKAYEAIRAVQQSRHSAQSVVANLRG